MFRILEIIIVVLIATASITAQAKDQTSARRTVTGTVVAYHYFSTLFPCYHICGGTVIVQVANSDGAAEYIEVAFTYPDRRFPVNLIKQSKSYRLKLTRDAERDEPLVEFVKQRNENGEESESPLKAWKLLPGAGDVKLPFGQTLPSYSLVGDVFDLIGRKK